MDRFFAIVNPAAGGGRSAKLAGPALVGLREKGLKIDVIASTGQGHAVQLAREAYDQGYRRFLAVGGDGTAHEILNGVFAGRTAVQRIALGFLPLGTGNSFLRDFTEDGAAASMQALAEGRTRAVDLLRLRHAAGEIFSFNLLSMGFTADVAEQIAEIAERLEHTIRQRGNIGRKAHTQKIEGVDFACSVLQPQKINGARAAFSQRLHRSCRSILCKVAQERIARAQWQESQSDALDRRASRKNSVENFVSCPVAAYCKEASVALIVGFAGQLHRVPLAGRSDDVNLQSFLAQAHQRRSREFRGAAATGGGVADGETS